MSRSALLAILLAGSAGAQPPTTYQPPRDFYGAVGKHISLTPSADKTRVPLGQTLDLTLTVQGANNPAEVKRPPLHDLPGFTKRFEVEDLPSTRPGVFVYRLRPRTIEVAQIPRIPFAYYNPAAAEGRQFPVTYSDTIPIGVVPPAEVATDAEMVPVPARFRDPSPPRGWSPPKGPAWLAGLSSCVLLLAGGYVAWWRWRNPDGPRLARIRQTRAVRRVLSRLTSAADPDDVATALCGYLTERSGSTIPSPAPCDIQDALLRAKFDAEKTRDVVTLVRQCDAVRFGFAAENTATLAARAKALVHRWEGLPC